MVHGQLRPSRGQVLVQGRGLHRWWRRGLDRIRRDVAFVFQEHHLLPRLTALENLTLALQVTHPQLPFRTIKQRALETLESMGLAHKRNAYPHQMSAGERQRVAVGRALATRPRVILADEPMASIDDDNARIVMRLLEDAAAAGTAVIVASHRHHVPFEPRPPTTQRDGPSERIAQGSVEWERDTFLAATLAPRASPPRTHAQARTQAIAARSGAVWSRWQPTATDWWF